MSTRGSTGAAFSAKHVAEINAVSEVCDAGKKRALMATRQKSIHRRRDRVAWADRIS